MLNKEAVKELYIKGFNAVEISKKLDGEVEAVRKCIQRNFWAFRKNHEMAILMKKEEAKAIKYEANKYMSDKTFILKNRSIYKTLPSGDIVLDKQAAGAVTWDTPRRLVNENKCII